MAAVTVGLMASFEGGLAAALTFLPVVALAAGLAAGLASGLASGLTVGLTRGLRSQHLRGAPRFLSGNLTIAVVVGLVDEHLDGFVVGLGFGLVAGLAAGLIGLRNAGPQPTRTRLQIRGRARFIAFGFAVGLAFVALLVVGAVALLMFVLVYGLAVGLVLGLVVALALGLETPVDTTDVVSAPESLVRDRRNTIRKILAFGLPVGLVFAISFGLVIGLVVVVVVGYVSVRATSAWIYWLVLVRGWLPLTGRLPWRVQAFLTDAYQRGVLRQTATVYQFRHARLQDQLIADTPYRTRNGANTG